MLLSLKNRDKPSDYEAAKSRRDIDEETMARLLAEATETLKGA